MKYILLFFILVSCKWSDEANCISEITKNEIASVNILKNSSLYSRYPFRIRLEKDGNLLLMDLHGIDNFCYRINIADQSKSSFSMRGQGPNDLQSAENIRIDKQANVYVLDANKQELSLYDRELLKPIRKIRLDKQLIRTLDFDIVNDSTFVVPDYSGEFRYHLLDKDGHITQSCFTIPLLKRDRKTHSIVYAQAWRSFIDYNPNNGILAMVTQLGQVLEIYSLKENKMINIVYGKFGEPEFIDKGAYAVPNGIMGYSDVYVADDKIYALFWGRTFKSIRNNQDSIEGGNQLEVYDLKGNPISKYILDKYITGFTMDEKLHQMIAIDINSDQPLIQFSLSNVEENMMLNTTNVASNLVSKSNGVSL